MFDSYGLSVTSLGSFSGQSPGISIDGLSTPFNLQTSLVLAVTSGTSVTLMTTGEAFQVVQGCSNLLASCGPGDWTDLTAPSGGLALGGKTFTQTFPPGSKGLVVDSGAVDSSTIDLGGAKSLRLKLNFDSISNPAAQITGTGSLAVTAIPEPGVWRSDVGRHPRRRGYRSAPDLTRQFFQDHDARRAARLTARPAFATGLSVVG